MKKVMLAANEQPKLEELEYPIMASGKIDGVRVCIQDNICVAGRSLKPSINKHVMEVMSRPALNGLDGELTVSCEKWNDFNTNQSAVMTKSGRPPQLTFHVFDDITLANTNAYDRKKATRNRVEKLQALELDGIELRFCQQELVKSADDLREMYDLYRSLGYEGLIVMRPTSLYKHGRSTLKQGIMLKLKPSEDSEGEIVGMEELMHNMDAGNSKIKENLVAGGVMGKLLIKWGGKQFALGTGFTHAQRKEMWENMENYIGKLAKFKFMELTPYGMPRSPVYVGLRSEDDLGE